MYSDCDAEPIAGRTGTVRERLRVLVAEDNPTFRMVLCAMLTQWGYDVQLVNDGNTAWRILQEDDAPRLAILDWMMPGMDGAEICRRCARRRATHISISFC